MSTGLPLARLCRTIRASCDTGASAKPCPFFRQEQHLSVWTMGELAQAGKAALSALTQVEEDLAHDAVHAVCSLGPADLGLPRQEFCDIGRFHSISNVTAGNSRTGFGNRR